MKHTEKSSMRKKRDGKTNARECTYKSYLEIASSEHAIYLSETVEE